MKNIIVFAPHPDDCELGCFATLSKLSNKYKVIIVNFSLCEESIPDGFSKDVLKGEAIKSQSLLPKSESIFFHFPVRRFDEHRQDILEEMISLRNKYSPELVFGPATSDQHQDHSVISGEMVRAFKGTCSIYGFDMPWNNISDNVNTYYHISESQLKLKIEAFNCFISQKFRLYGKDEITALARLRGLQCGTKYAEAFESIKCIIK